MSNKRKIYKTLMYYHNEIKTKGIKTFLSNRTRRLNDIFSFYLTKVTHHNKYFIFNKKKYSYLIDKYNFTWRNERTVEVPIGYALLKQYKKYPILEVGNVLSHYFPVHHEIIDKYEITNGVMNEDVVSFRSSKKYKLIISLSTLEHVGWDEKNQIKDKIIPAVKNLCSLLDKDGLLFITLPLGYYNPVLQEIIVENKLKFTKQYFMKRVSRDNQWKQTSWDDVKRIKYNTPFPHANGILLGVIKNEIS